MVRAERLLFCEADDWEAVRRFHGHLGPWLAAGMKAGRRLLAETAAGPHFGFTVWVTCPPRPPVSCVIDGLQIGTGATYGKQNLLAAAGDAVTAELRPAAGGGARVVFGDHLPDWFARLMAGGDDAGAARTVWETPDDELFRVERLPD